MIKLNQKFFLLLILLSVSTTTLFSVPDRDTCFEKTAIRPEKAKMRRFVLADRVDGVYFGKTYKYKSGDYRIADKFAFSDFVVMVDGRILNPSGADECTLYPYGISYRYGTVVTKFMLLQNQRGVTITVTADPGSRIEIIPLLLIAGKESEINYSSKKGVQIITRQEADPDYILCAAVVTNCRAGVYSAVSAPVDLAKAVGRTLPAGQFSRNGSAVVSVLFGDDVAVVQNRAERYAKRPEMIPEEVEEFFYQMLSRSWFECENELINRAWAWSVISGSSFVNQRFTGTGIYAGFPWFMQNWGRDTFIALPGISLVTGRFAEAKEVLSTFVQYQNKRDNRLYGRIPNRVMDKSIIYNTVDGTPWMFREAWEYLQYSGDHKFAEEIYNAAVIAIDGAVENFVDENGFLTHYDAETWMDAKLEGSLPWSPRGNRAVEIEALWYNQLLVTAELAKLAGDDDSAGRYLEMAAQVQVQFETIFWNKRTNMLYDRISRDGKPDARIRPNQIMAHTVVQGEPLLSHEQATLMITNTCRKLLYPYGIASLDKNDPYYHPFHNNYKMHHKDAAYHNGTIWGWNAGFTIEGLVDVGYHELAGELTENLADQIVNLGCLGSMSENIDATPKDDGSIGLTGTYSQAWSVSEFTRVIYQSYAGIRPDLMHDRIYITPKIPQQFGNMSIIQPLGEGEVMLHYTTEKDKKICTISQKCVRDLTLVLSMVDDNGGHSIITISSRSEQVYTVEWSESGFLVDGKVKATETYSPGYKSVAGTLEFESPRLPGRVPSLTKKDYLKTILKKGRYKFPNR